MPVVISDTYVFPVGPDWDTFTIRIAEVDVEQIPARLEAVADAAEAMGQKARQAWEDYFSPASSFHSLVGWTLQLKQGMAVERRRAMARQIALGEYLTPPNIRTHLRRFKPQPRKAVGTGVLK